MKFSVNSEKYGKIEYFESAWTGKKSVTIADNKLMQVSKDNFIYKTTAGDLGVKVEGSYMRGVTIDVAGDKIEVIEKPKWYVLTIEILLFILVVVWANVPALCRIFPIVGGAIGGLVMGVAVIASYMLSRTVKKPIYKILVIIGVFLVGVLICYLLGLLVISLIK